MRIIIAGSRDVENPLAKVTLAMMEALDKWGLTYYEVSTILSGTCRGIDRAGEGWAHLNHVRVAQFPADWANKGKGAGYSRNVQMAENADALVAIWDGKSRGTKHMIDIATKRGLKVHVYEVRPTLYTGILRAEGHL